MGAFVGGEGVVLPAEDGGEAGGGIAEVVADAIGGFGGVVDGFGVEGLEVVPDSAETVDLLFVELAGAHGEDGVRG